MGHYIMNYFTALNKIQSTLGGLSVNADLFPTLSEISNHKVMVISLFMVRMYRPRKFGWLVRANITGKLGVFQCQTQCLINTVDTLDGCFRHRAFVFLHPFLHCLCFPPHSFKIKEKEYARQI